MGWSVTAGEVVVIITTLSTAVVAVVTALRTGQVKTQQATIEAKVDTVHELTNSRLARIEGLLATTQHKLEAATLALAKAEEVRGVLASETAAVVAAQAGPAHPRRGGV